MYHPFDTLSRQHRPVRPAPLGQIRRQSRLVRWGVAALTCVVLGSAMAVPEHLPMPVQRTLDAAVARAAHFWLWVLNQPRDGADDPSATWNARPGPSVFDPAAPPAQRHA